MTDLQIRKLEREHNRLMAATHEHDGYMVCGCPLAKRIQAHHRPTDPHPDQRIEEAAREIAREITRVGGVGPDEWNALVEINRLRLRPMLQRLYEAGKRAGAEEVLERIGTAKPHPASEYAGTILLSETDVRRAIREARARLSEEESR